MKRTILCTAFILLFASSAFAANMFTTVIRDTTIPVVQETIINVFSPKGFAVADVGSNKVALNKSFGDGFFTAIRNRTVLFTLLQQNEDVKMMVSQNELNSGWIQLQNNIEHLVPLIKEVRHAIDGTPSDQIVNETPAPGGASTPAPKKIGLVLVKAEGQEYYIAEVEKGGEAEKAGLASGMVVYEINGKVLNDMKNQREVENYINTKWSAGSSLIFLYDKDGTKEILTLKKTN
ncbi:MAG: PDZ domain-containing protein [Synergistaceae bacterium]|nr:PDZ domain-containing protein [Synergistaceae bacterium]